MNTRTTAVTRRGRRATALTMMVAALVLGGTAAPSFADDGTATAVIVPVARAADQSAEQPAVDATDSAAKLAADAPAAADVPDAVEPPLDDDCPGVGNVDLDLTVAGCQPKGLCSVNADQVGCPEPEPATCGTGTHDDGTGTCVPDESTTCPDGTIPVADVCIADPGQGGGGGTGGGGTTPGGGGGTGGGGTTPGGGGTGGGTGGGSTTPSLPGLPSKPTVPHTPGTPGTSTPTQGLVGQVTGSTGTGNAIGTTLATAEGTVPGVTVTAVTACGDSVICTSTPASSTTSATPGSTLPDTGAPAHAGGLLAAGAGLFLGGAALMRPRRRRVVARPTARHCARA